MSLLARIRGWKFRRNARTMARLLRRINLMMIRQGWSRQRRQQFWGDLIKHDSMREDLFARIYKQLK